MRTADAIPDVAGVASRQPRTAPISTELLVPFFRISRMPLAMWTGALLDRFARAQADARADVYSAAEGLESCFNEGALVTVHFGLPEHALILCRTGIDYARRLTARTGRLAAARFGCQPYVNEGRLDRNNRQWDEAIAKFQLLKRFVDGHDVELGTWPLTAHHRDAIRQEDPEFVERMAANHAVDTVITLIRGERFVDASRFANEHGVTETDWVRDLLREADIIALSHLGETARALALTESRHSGARQANRAVFMCRRAEILAALGDRAGAVMLARAIANAHLGSPVPVDRVNVRLLARVARLLADSRDERVVALLRLGLASAEHMNDVSLRQEFLTLLAAHEVTTDAREEARQRADAIKRDSGYGAARRGPAPAAAGVPVGVPVGAPDPLRARIEELYEGLRGYVDAL
jgi:hypothetical protein